MRQRREQDRREGTVEAAEPRRAPSSLQRLLELQRSAGNAAVGRMLQRQPVDAPNPAPVMPPAPAVDPNSFSSLSEDAKAKIDALKAADDAVKAATTATAKKEAKKARAKALAAHQKGVVALAGWTRDNMPPRAVLDGYLDRTDLTADAKTATLGKLAASVARMEFLLGTMYHQGVSASWEESGANKGEFPDTYDAAVHGGAQPWCTKFAGYAYTRLGFQANKDGTQSEFMSGYRMREWSTAGKGVSNETITAADQTAEDAAGTGSAVIDKDAWKQLRKDLKKATTDAERLATTQAFFAGGAHPLPQAGDIVIKPRGDAESNNEFTGGGKSHTMLVESFDAATFKIHTIEGNVKDKVGGRTIDLTNAVDVSKIIVLTRMGTQFFGASPTAAGGTGATGTSISSPAGQAKAAFGPGIMGDVAGAVTTAFLGTLYSDETLTGGMQKVIEKLVEIDAAQGWIKSAAADASVTDWTGVTGSGNEG